MKVIVGIPLVLAISLIVFVSGQRNRFCLCENRDQGDPVCTDDDVDCSTQNECFFVADSVAGSGSVGEVACDRDLQPNMRSLYRTCIGDPDEFFGNDDILLPDDPFRDDTCFVRASFENRTLPPAFGDEYRYRIHSTNFYEIAGKFYRDNTIQRYLAVCEPGEILHFTINDHKIEPMRDCPDGVRRCVDELTRDRHGALLTSCGREMPQEIMGQIDPPRLTVKFKANKKFGDCGFNINVMCNKESAFNLPGCTTPDDAPRPKQRRDLSLYNTEDIFKVRARRGFRVPHITVPSGAVVQYVGFTVRVVRDGIWLYKFPNIDVFQVYNRAEGYQTFKGSGPPDRDFPGFGYLQIGNGVVEYVQTGVPDEFLPSPAEEEIIRELQERIIVAFAGPDFDGEDGFDGPLPDVSECLLEEFSAADDCNFRAQAFRNRNACNDVLGAYSRALLGLVPEPPQGCPPDIGAPGIVAP